MDEVGFITEDQWKKLKPIDYIYSTAIVCFTVGNHKPIQWSVKSNPDNWDDIKEKKP